MSFQNKTVFITGASRGIGKAIALRLAKEGANIIVAAKSVEENPKLGGTIFSAAQEIEEAGGKALAVQCDIRFEDQIKNAVDKAVETFGGIDILINNAGISMRTLLKDAEMDVFKKVMDINFWGTVYCTKFALDSILKNKGSIVGMSSVAGYRGLPGRSGYSASKFAVNGWLEALRTELLESGVNVMWVCPGYTKSNIRNAALDKNARPQGESPLKEEKLMSAQECANHIIKAIEKRKRTLVLTFTGKETVYLNKFFPSLTDKLTRKFFFKNGELIK